MTLQLVMCLLCCVWILTNLPVRLTDSGLAFYYFSDHLKIDSEALSFLPAITFAGMAGGIWLYEQALDRYKFSLRRAIEVVDCASTACCLIIIFCCVSSLFGHLTCCVRC